jgi:hypothetical protein
MSDDPIDTVSSRLPKEKAEATTQILRSTVRLAVGSADGFPPLADLLMIIENLGKLARDTIDEEFPVKHSVDDLEGRSNWFRIVSFLANTGAFPPLNSLAVALSELDRGRQPDSLKPFYTGQGSGSRIPHFELTVQQQAVEAADRVASFCSKDEQRDAEFRDCGVSARTIERYRESCMKGWPMFWPRDDALADHDLPQAREALRSAMKHAKLLQNTRPSKAARAN